MALIEAMSTRLSSTKRQMPERPCRNGLRHRRGTAEIETIFACFVLITILAMAKFMFDIAQSRQTLQDQAGEQAFHDGTDTNDPQFATNPPVSPVDESPFMNTGQATLPDLPNRMHVPALTGVVTANMNPHNPDPDKCVDRQFNNVNTAATAALAAPAWMFSAYPVGGSDEDATEAWFNAYVLQSHEEFVQPLGLAAPWTP